MPPFVNDTNKTKAAYMNGLRTQWQTAKTKHAEAITAKKIKFDKGLGKLLTNRVEMHRGIQAFRAGDSTLLLPGKLNALKANGKSITTTITSYLGRVHGMGEPAEHELTTLLHKIDTDAGQYDVGFVNQKIASMRAAEARRKEKAKADEAKRKQRAKAEAEREKARKGK